MRTHLLRVLARLTTLILLPLAAGIAVSAGVSLWIKADGTDRFLAQERGMSMHDPEICATIRNAENRDWCKLGSVMAQAKTPSGVDCEPLPATLRAQCLFQAAAVNHGEVALCRRIDDGYFARRCHFVFQPAELSTPDGRLARSYVAGSLGLAWLAMFLMLLIWRRRVAPPSWVTGLALGLTAGAIVLALSRLGPFEPPFYHWAVLKRLGCPPNSQLCETNGWISLPNGRGLFVMLLLCPLLYGALGLAASAAVRILGPGRGSRDYPRGAGMT